MTFLFPSNGAGALRSVSGSTIVGLSLALALVAAGPALAQNPVRVNWTAVTGAQSGMFMAHQEGLFKKHGADVELIHIPSSSRGIQAILAGEISFSFMDGANAATNVITVNDDAEQEDCDDRQAPGPPVADHERHAGAAQNRRQDQNGPVQGEEPETRAEKEKPERP